MNRALQIIQVLSLIFISVALGYYFFSDSTLILEKTEIADSFNPKDKLHFSFKSGFYTEAIHLEITNPKDSSCTIFYTLDCSIPTNNSLKYNSPIQIDFSNPHTLEVRPREHQTSVIRCIAYSDKDPVSEVKTGVFFIDSLIFSKYPYPVLSLVMEPEVLLAPGTAEIRVHVTLVENNGVVGISQDAGLQILADSTKEIKMGSLMLSSRKKYATRYFDYPIFKSENKPKYQGFGLELILKTSEFIERDMNNLESILEESNVYAVYINGGFQGIYRSVSLKN